MLCGVTANVIFMIGDWLFNAFGTENVEIGLLAQTGFSNIAMWRLTASILAGAIGICFFVPGANAFMRLSERTCRQDNRTSRVMSKIFQIGLYTGMISSFCIHTLCCMAGVIWKSALAAGTSEEVAANITNMSATTFIVPFMVFYLVLEFATGIPYIYKVVTGELKLKKIAVLCCSLVTLILLSFVKLFDSQTVNDIFCAKESFGWVLMFLMGYIALGRCEEQA